MSERENKLIDKTIDNFQMEQMLSNRYKNYSEQRDINESNMVLTAWKKIVEITKVKTDKTEKFKQGVFVMVRLYENYLKKVNECNAMRRERDYLLQQNELLELENKQYETIKRELPNLIK